MSNITIKNYNESTDAESLFALMHLEDDWGDYLSDDGNQRYKIALKQSTTFVLYEGDNCCGFIRVKDDFGFWVNIYDLLVGKLHRGKNYGKMLIEHVCKTFEGCSVCTLSDVDGYYTKAFRDAQIIGSVIELQKGKSK